MALVQGSRGLRGWLSSIRAASSCAISSSASCRHVQGRPDPDCSVAQRLASWDHPILREPRGPLSSPRSQCVVTHAALQPGIHLMQSSHADCSLGARSASNGATSSSLEVPSMSCAALPAPPQWRRQHSCAAAEGSQSEATHGDASWRLSQHSASIAEQRSSRSSASSAPMSTVSESAAFSLPSAFHSTTDAAARGATRLHHATAWRRASPSRERCVQGIMAHSCHQLTVHLKACCPCHKGVFHRHHVPCTKITVACGRISSPLPSVRPAGARAHSLGRYAAVSGHGGYHRLQPLPRWRSSPRSTASTSSQVRARKCRTAI